MVRTSMICLNYCCDFCTEEKHSFSVSSTSSPENLNGLELLPFDIGLQVELTFVENAVYEKVRKSWGWSLLCVLFLSPLALERLFLFALCLSSDSFLKLADLEACLSSLFLEIASLLPVVYL